MSPSEVASPPCSKPNNDDILSALTDPERDVPGHGRVPALQCSIGRCRSGPGTRSSGTVLPMDLGRVGAWWSGTWKVADQPELNTAAAMEALGYGTLWSSGGFDPGALHPLRPTPRRQPHASRWPAASSASGPARPRRSDRPWPSSKPDTPAASSSASAPAIAPSSGTTPSLTPRWSPISMGSTPSSTPSRRSGASSPRWRRGCSSWRPPAPPVRIRTSCRSSTPRWPAAFSAPTHSWPPRWPWSSRPTRPRRAACPRLRQHLPGAAQLHLEPTPLRLRR